MTRTDPMASSHPITPPPELFKQWEDGWFDESESADSLLLQAFQAGADQELEACCEWLKAKQWTDPEFAAELRAVRRPKPPSLKEQALRAADLLFNHSEIGECALAQATIRRALEALPE